MAQITFFLSFMHSILLWDHLFSFGGKFGGWRTPDTRRVWKSPPDGFTRSKSTPFFFCLQFPFQKQKQSQQLFSGNKELSLALGKGKGYLKASPFVCFLFEDSHKNTKETKKEQGNNKNNLPQIIAASSQQVKKRGAFRSIVKYRSFSWAKNKRN